MKRALVITQTVLALVARRLLFSYCSGSYIFLTFLNRIYTLAKTITLPKVCLKHFSCKISDYQQNVYLYALVTFN